MKKEIIINATSNEMRVALTEDGRLAEIFLEVQDKQSRIGSIYLGKVQRVVQGMNAAFIDIGESQHAFLHFSDVGTKLDEFKEFLEEIDSDDAEETPLPAELPAGNGADRSPATRSGSSGRSAAKRKPSRSSSPTPRDEPSQSEETESSSQGVAAPEDHESESRQKSRRRGKRGSRGGRKNAEDQHRDVPASQPHDDEATEQPTETDHPTSDASGGDSAEEAERKRRRRRGRRGRGRRGRGGEADSAGEADAAHTESAAEASEDRSSNDRTTNDRSAHERPSKDRSTKGGSKPSPRNQPRNARSLPQERATEPDAASEPDAAPQTESEERPRRGRGGRRGARKGSRPTGAGSGANEEGQSNRTSTSDSGERESARESRASDESKSNAGGEPKAPSDGDAKPTGAARKRSSRRGGRGRNRGGSGRSGDGESPPKGGDTMDAKLPTFQTKRSGEVTIALERGQDVIVQVTRESYSSKGVRVSTKVSLPGRFLVLLPLDPSIGVSRKVQHMKERRRLRRIAQSLLPEGHGCIIRTNAENKDSDVIRQDLVNLINQWRSIEVKLKEAEKPTLLYRDQSVANTVMRDMFTPDINRVVIDNHRLYKDIHEYVEWAAPQLADKVELYSGDKPIFDETGIEKEIERIYEPRVWLPSGGYIILEQTEAMMVIDVNSGRYADSKEQEINSLRTNMESAREIARQLRLRDIGGLIVVDFIDLYDERNRKKVHDEIKREMRRDRAKSVVLPMTQFGLVQMTRQRIRQQILHTLSEQCPTCEGSGLVQSRSTVTRRIERWLQRFKEEAREFRLTLSAHPTIIEYLTDGGDMSRLTRLMLKYFVRIKVVPDNTLAFHDFRFFTARGGIDVTDKYLD